MTVTVVIPAVNEQLLVLDAVRSARADGADEIVVVDGGSTDRTVEVASEHARVIHGPRGRARQMNRGAQVARGDVLLFLHADSRLSPGSIASIVAAIEAGARAGCFRLRFEPSSPLLRIYASFTSLPLRSLCFGDRGLFVDRALFESIGGFADTPAFEDLDIVKRLARSGSFVRLRREVTTSSRRFKEHGPVRQQALNLMLWTAYQLGVDPGRLARYYGYSTDHRSE